MPAVQRTFDLVPKTLARTIAQPPMTSKAAKKAYQKANAGPRISKAEQRRRDAEELAKLRRENEKEKAAVKAKAAREKKALKAKEEREERKRNGQPEPSRFVRPSQPTISVFVQGGNRGVKRAWKEVEMSGLKTDPQAGKEDVAEPPAKIIALDDDCRVDELATDAKFESIADEDTGEAKRDSEDVTTNGLALEETIFTTPPVLFAKGPADRDSDSDDDFGEFLSPSQADILQKTGLEFLLTESHPCPTTHSDQAPTGPTSSRNSPDKSLVRPFRCSPPSSNPRHNVVPLEPAIKGLQNRQLAQHDEEHEFDDGMISTQLLTEVMALSESRAKSIAPSRLQVDPPPPKPVLRPPSVSSHQRPSLSERHTNMPPPKQPLHKPKPITYTSQALNARPAPQLSMLNRPNKFPYTPRPSFLIPSKVITTPIAPPQRRPRFLPSNATPSNRFISNKLPMSTQQVLDNLEDFLPSPTQELRELIEEDDDDHSLPSNNYTPKKINPIKSVTKSQPLEMEEFMFPSTQDLILSSQDLREISTPNRNSTPSHPLPPQAVLKPVRREKRRFFQEKDEDLRRAGLLRPITTLSQPQTNKQPLVDQPADEIEEEEYTPSIQAAIAENNHLSLLRKQAEDDESLALAIRESEKAAALAKQRTEEHDLGLSWSGHGARSRFFQEKEEDMIEAARYESLVLEKKENKGKRGEGEDTAISKKGNRSTDRGVNTDKDGSREKRTLQRQTSTSTDWGEDGDMISSQDLLALCGGLDV